MAKEKKKQVEKKKRKKGDAIDYSEYEMSFGETLFAIAVGFGVGFGASWLYFGITIISIIVGGICAWRAISIFRNRWKKKRLNVLREQFRDMLESLSNSFTVGKNANAAFRSAYDDMLVEHGPKAYITKELAYINKSHDNMGKEIRELLLDFGDRSGIEDVKNFASVFDVCANLAGDVGRVVRETRDMINDKIEVELEIQTMVTGQKNQLNILAIMPIMMSALMRFMNLGSNGALVVVVKCIALGIFVFAYWIGTRITDIKV